jgi:NAD(P)-dependent dehydrogenase (short-subunit alcohol dehydrogenase family)
MTSDTEPTPAQRYLGDLFGVAGKVVVVTGGGRGIGEMIAEGFVKAGARVYIASRNADVLAQTAARLEEFGECIAVPADLGTVDGIHTLAAEISRREERVHVLVNNSGAAWGAPIDTYSADGFDRVLNVNLKSVFVLTQQLLPLLRAAASAADPARVINIGSVNGITSPKAGNNNWAYSASKAGVHMLSKHLALDLAAEHITVNAVAPGPFETKMMAHVFNDVDRHDTLLRRVPLHRSGVADDAAGATIFLASRAGAFLTGVVLPVSGGIEL